MHVRHSHYHLVNNSKNFTNWGDIRCLYYCMCNLYSGLKNFQGKNGQNVFWCTWGWAIIIMQLKYITHLSIYYIISKQRNKNRMIVATLEFIIAQSVTQNKQKWKMKKKTLGFRILQKYGKFWRILLGHFIKHKPPISEEWLVDT